VAAQVGRIGYSGVRIDKQPAAAGELDGTPFFTRVGKSAASTAIPSLPIETTIPSDQEAYNFVFPMINLITEHPHY